MSLRDAARKYHDEGLCVIPVVPRQKRPAIDWERYQTTRSTKQEVQAWWRLNPNYNVGIVHGKVSHGNSKAAYVTIDIDHDDGLYDAFKSTFPRLLKGRVEQSGSLEGYHVPFLLDVLPDFGHNGDKPKGNKTWKTDLGNANIRARRAQTVVPPSVHPSGNRYRYIQKGPITRVHDLNAVIGWLTELAPEPEQDKRPLHRRKQRHQPVGNGLLDAVLDAWTPLDVFQHFGMASHVQREHGEVRLLGHGGLLVDDERWYCFEAEYGGGAIEAWGWARHGSAFNKDAQLRETLLEMAQAAGMDTARWYRPGDERVSVPDDGDRGRWKRDRAWGRMR